MNGTSSARSHLEEKHNIDPQSGKKKVGSARKSVLDQQVGAAAATHFSGEIRLRNSKIFSFDGLCIATLHSSD
jgi:hypothetical protein